MDFIMYLEFKLHYDRSSQYYKIFSNNYVIIATGLALLMKINF